jgi:cation diffusion facilitator CzcD-associated flavoprotein CzcO
MEGGMASCDVAIIGAGPYGLSAAAHLQTVKGLDVRVFGEPMSFWQRNMPEGMFLRSNWSATQIADPERCLTLEHYQAETGSHFSTPVPIEDFVQYGLWYQRQGVPNLDQRKVASVLRGAKGFRLLMEDGEEVRAGRVVIAVGINSFAWRPPEFRALPAHAVSHSSEHSDLSAFAGKVVLVIGSGQSALESCALLHECGAEVEAIGKATKIHWLQGSLSRTLHHRLGKLTRRLLYAPTDVGPAGVSQLMARPDLLRHFPRAFQDKVSRRCIRPAGARWLVERLHGVPITLGRHVVSASIEGDRVKLILNDGIERTADHVILGTGYRIDISKYPFFTPELVKSLDQVNGYPRLKEGLESSVARLHFVGAPAAWSFGPLMRFISGAGYASRALLKSIA